MRGFFHLRVGLRLRQIQANGFRCSNRHVANPPMGCWECRKDWAIKTVGTYKTRSKSFCPSAMLERRYASRLSERLGTLAFMTFPALHFTVARGGMGTSVAGLLRLQCLPASHYKDGAGSDSFELAGLVFAGSNVFLEIPEKLFLDTVRPLPGDAMNQGAPAH